MNIDRINELARKSKAEGLTEEEKAERKKRLDRYGFLEREDQDASEGRCRCGVPMGGIGAGKIELDKEGVLTAITINNNCEVPIYKTRGSFFAARVRQGKRVQASLLQTTDISGNGFPVLDEIDFTGRFPHAQLQYKKNGFPVKLSMDAFSALVPYDEKNSSLPTASPADLKLLASVQMQWFPDTASPFSALHRMRFLWRKRRNCCNTRPYFCRTHPGTAACSKRG